MVQLSAVLGLLATASLVACAPAAAPVAAPAPTVAPDLAKRLVPSTQFHSSV
jgi:galacturan 1,4-alpha-galacturonidase